MAVSINYLSLNNMDLNLIGQIDFFDQFVLPTRDFPYFFLDQQSTNISYNNWPDLVPYLYLQKIKIVNNDKSLIENFKIYSFTASTGTVTLNFTNTDSMKIIRALNEDRLAFFLEYGTYTGWNKTFTPINDITNATVTFFTANQNYYITNILINEINNTGTITATSSNQTNVTTPYILNEKYIEFGLHRIPNQTNIQMVYYSGIKGRYFCNNMNGMFNGLKIRSQMIGHIHEHTHEMSNHTHTLAHSHNIGHHSHYMDHTHNYWEGRSDVNTISTAAWRDGHPITGPYDTYRVTDYTRDYTDGPTNNSTNNVNVTSNSISNNITSENLVKTTNIDNIYSNDFNLKINNKIIPETYTIFPYIYGKTYIG